MKGKRGEVKVRLGFMILKCKQPRCGANSCITSRLCLRLPQISHIARCLRLPQILSQITQGLRLPQISHIAPGVSVYPKYLILPHVSDYPKYLRLPQISQIPQISHITPNISDYPVSQITPNF